MNFNLDKLYNAIACKRYEKNTGTLLRKNIVYLNLLFLWRRRNENTIYIYIYNFAVSRVDLFRGFSIKIILRTT